MLFVACIRCLLYAVFIEVVTVHHHMFIFILYPYRFLTHPSLFLPPILLTITIIFILYISDLARIESDAEIRNLTSQIEELQIQKEMEITYVRTESIELEKILITSFREESEMYRKEASIALESAKKELKYEQTRRQQLQLHLTESETELLNKIQNLEEVNIRLQNRADQADLESTRLRMESLHTSVSQKP